MDGTADSRQRQRAMAAGGRLSGSLRPPSSKSLTQRYLALALLASSPSRLRRPLVAADTEAFARGLELLGCGLERRRDGLRVTPPAAAGLATLDCGAGGTMLRLLTAACAALPGEWTLDGVPRLRERPLAPLVEALREAGARIDYLERSGHAPVRVAGGSLRGGEVTVDAGDSSQFVSALLLAGCRASRGLDLRVGRLTSAPYVELTLAAMGEFGVAVERPAGNRFRVPAASFPGRELTVEADASAACYPAAAAALTGGEVRLVGLRRDSCQGDLGFLEVLASMGAAVSWRGGRLEVLGAGRLVGVERDLSSMPDQVPTLAALAPFAAGTTRITNVPHLRLKESDRLRAMAVELRRLGAVVEERPDGLVIPGVWAERPAPAAPVVVDSHDDHRIAMSLAVTGLRRPGVTVANPAVVAKSYPDFWRDLDRLLG